VLATDLFLEFLDLFLDELENRAALHADEVLVVLASERSLVERAPVPHGVTAKKTGLYQVRKSAVDRGAGNPDVVAAERVDQLFSVKVPEVTDGVIENRPSPGGQPEAALSESFL